MNPLSERNPYARLGTFHSLLKGKFAEHEEALRTPADEQTVSAFRQVVDEMDDAQLHKLTTEKVLALAVEHRVATFQAMRVLHARL